MDAGALRRQVKGMIDARLRSDIVPTVIDEESAAVASYEAADAEDLVDAALEGMDAGALRRQVKGMIDARLRSDIVPTVIDEESAAVASYEAADAEDLVDAALEGMDAGALRRQVKGMIDARLRSDIVPTVIDEESAAVASYEAADAEDLVDAALEGMDAGALRRQVKGMIDARLRSDIVPTVIDEESAAVASYEAADAEDLVDAALEGMDAGALRRQVKGMIDARLRSDIVPTVVDEVSAAVSASDLTELHDRIQEEVASADIDVLEARFRELVSSTLHQRMQGAMTAEVSHVEAKIGDIATAFIQERMGQLTSSDDWRVALADAEAAFCTGIVAMIEDSVATETAFAQRIDEAIDGRITGNTEFMTRLEQQAKYRLVRVVAQDVMAKMDRNDFVKNDVVTEVTSNEAVITPIVETVSDSVLEHIVSNTLDRFDNAEDAAAVAMVQIDTEQPKIVQVVKELEKTLTKHVSDTAAAHLADHDSLSQMSEKWLEKDEQVVSSAVGYLLQHITSVIRDRVTLEASQTETIVGNVLPSFTAETDEVRAAIRETRNRLIDRVVNLTFHDMANPDHVAVEANKRVADENERLRNAVSASVEMLTERVSMAATEHLKDSSEIASQAVSALSSDLPEFERTVKATMALLHGQIASEVGLRLKSSDVVAADARMLLAEKPAEVEEAVSLLENTILNEVAGAAKDLLYDVQGASERARTFLKATKEIDAIEEAVRVQLFKSMAGKVVADLHDVDKTSTEAFWHLDQQHAHVRNAMSELRRQLLFTIAKETMTSLADSEAVASESHHLIPASSGPLTEAASRLRDKLVADVAEEALELMKDTEAVVSQADAQMGDNEEVLANMRGIVERHLMESLLASALSEIGTKVSGMDDAAERLFFRNAVKEIQNVRENAHSEDEEPVKVAATLSNEKDVTEAQASWSSLEELSSSTEKEPSAKSWRVNEFRPEDWDAVPGASADVNRTKVRAFSKGE